MTDHDGPAPPGEPADARRVECDEHGPQEATFVCGHLARSLALGVRAGFFTSGSDAPRPDAWCAACEEAVGSTGGEWTDGSEAFAGITLMCASCYDAVRALNEPGA